MANKVSIIFGTRPEAIKLAPVINELRKHDQFQVNVCVTGQHREMLDQVLKMFNIKPDHDLQIMKHNQTLPDLTGDAIKALDKYIALECPDLVLVQGDTTTVFAASVASFYNKVPIGHVEAGLRTNKKYAPFPEEMNRVLTTRLSDIHFAPTELSKENLVKEGVPPQQVFVTGNTVIDALIHTKGLVEANPPVIGGVPQTILSSSARIVLITGHRRENFGSGFESICKAILDLSEEFPDDYFIYPVHLNPNVKEPVFRILGNKPNILLIQPLDYLQFVYLMTKAHIILTDSGGVQEEAPSLGKPVLVMRDTTERPEGLIAGTVKLVGNDSKSIVLGVSELLRDRDVYASMANRANPYGDGTSAKRIGAILTQYLGSDLHRARN